MPSLHRLIIALLLASLAPVAASAKPGKAAVAVSTAQAEQVTLPESVQAQGAVSAWQEAVVSARLGGAALVELHASIGERVRRGSLLARFDDRTVRADHDKALAALAQARASDRQARLDRERSRALQGSGAISEQELLQAETHAELTRAQSQAAQAALQAASIRLEDTRVLAPDDGLVTARAAVLGQVPNLGAELFRMIRQERLEWRAELPAAQLARVRRGMAVHLSLPGGGTVQGKVRQLGGALEGPNRVGLAYVDLEPGHGAKAGMYASGGIALAQTPALLVPAASVVVRDGRASVFRVDQAKVRQIAVLTGRRRGEQIEILKGARPGDVIVVQGAGFLVDGDAVTVMTAAPSRPQQ